LIVIIIGAIVIKKVRGGAMGAKKVVFILLAGVIMVGLKPHWLEAAEAGTEWQRTLTAAKKEGKVVIGAPPGNDFRNEVQAVLKKRFDLDSEFIQAPGPNLMSKIVAEKQAGAVSVDAFLVGPCTGNTLLKTDLFEPLTAAMILPEVSDPAKWFGGHLWADNQTGKNLLYSFVAQVTPSSITTRNWSSRRRCGAITICSIPNGKEKSACAIRGCRAAALPCGRFCWT
jgi:hypothetical protein